jgi:HEAT repeat protein
MGQSQHQEVSDEQLKEVIADFLEMGHVDNIIAMFRHDQRYYQWVGEILADERFSVRLGISVLFEELKELEPDQLRLAIPSLTQLLNTDDPLYRGEALSLLGIVCTADALELVARHLGDENPQVREMAELILEEHS